MTATPSEPAPEATAAGRATATDTPVTAATDDPSEPPRPPFLAGRGELVVSALLLVLGTVLVVGNLTMDVVGEGGALGPRAFGWIVAVLSYAGAVLLAVDVLRRPARERASIAADPGKQMNLPALAGALGGLVGFVLLLDLLGWILAATGLFFAVSTSLGSRPLVRNLLVGFVMAATLQLLFGAALGLALPAGLLGRF